MEGLYSLQQRLYEENQQRFLQTSESYHIGTFFHNIISLFSGGSFTGTPAQFRGSLDEFLVLAAHFGINLEDAIWNKFPAMCPYCLEKRCICTPVKKNPAYHLRIKKPKQELSIGFFQEMFGDIYPPMPLYTTIRILFHIFEEMFEVDQELWIMTLSNQKKRREAENEFADIIAWMIQMANTLGIDLQGLKTIPLHL